MKSLGETLKEARELAQLTLKQVEESTGISNAYMSQVENSKIKKPSANVLHKLSRVYDVNMETLLLAAGAIKESNAQKTNLLNAVASKAETTLTPEEEQALMDYLRFLRFKKKNG